MKLGERMHYQSKIAFGFVVFFLAGQSGLAILPPYTSDNDLARQPVIVEAKWERAPFHGHPRYEQREGEKVVVDFEGFTQLRIIRVIKGDATPGSVEIKLGYAISWAKDGKYLMSGTSTEVMGDVSDVTRPNIWFLNRQRSWDVADTNEYLSVDNYRWIQPVNLAPFYLALGSQSPEMEVPQLLSSKDSVVVTRALRFVCGDVLPSLVPSEFAGLDPVPSQKGARLTNEAERVRVVMEGRDRDDVRALSLLVYAELVGRNGIQPIRNALKDKSPEVRANAIVTLAGWKDDPSIDPILIAIQGISGPVESCEIIKQFGLWGDERLVPGLIYFLDNNKSAGSFGDNHFVPALKAREALAIQTEHQFPFDVKSSRNAWERVRTISDHSERTRVLKELVPSEAIPISAEVIGDGSTNAAIRVTNRSSRNVRLAKVPAIDLSWPGGVAGGAMYGGMLSKAVVNLRPGESITFKILLNDSFLLAEPATRKLTLSYTGERTKLEKDSWIGVVNAEFGKEWKETRKKVTVESKWPNGNLKESGQMVNGNRFGKWEFFNEAGDRIKTVDYTGGVTAICNPEYPANKGAGKR